MVCHGEAIGMDLDIVNDSMVGGDMTLKNKIIKDRMKYNERKTFEERITWKNFSRRMLRLC
jgi:hypothetical protein